MNDSVPSRTCPDAVPGDIVTCPKHPLGCPVVPEVGQEVLVDTSAYGVPGENWCRVVYTNFWSAAVYPVKVDIPGRGRGQYKATECLQIRGEAGGGRG